MTPVEAMRARRLRAGQCRDCGGVLAGRLPCPACGGSGRRLLLRDGACPHCDGVGHRLGPTATAKDRQQCACRTCHGTGRALSWELCQCRGTGLTLGSRRFCARCLERQRQYARQARRRAARHV